MNTIKLLLSKYNNAVDQLRPILADAFLLLVRCYWGLAFLQTGLGKFRNFERTAGFFQSLNIPFPELNVVMAAGTEFGGGLLILLGLGSRIIPIPLIFTMIVAYVTAHTTELSMIISDTDEFLGAPPFLFMYASVICLIFGYGKVSLDYLLFKDRARL